MLWSCVVSKRHSAGVTSLINIGERFIVVLVPIHSSQGIT